MTQLVSSDDYVLLKNNPTKTVENKVIDVIKRTNEFDDKTRRQLTPQNSKPPHIHGLVKVHKPGYPIRHIVSCIYVSTQKIARYIVPILNSLVGKTNTYVKNLQDFIHKISGLDIPAGSIIGSFDVLNFFTTTPIHSTLVILKHKLEEDVAFKI
jgi:hypothetical protein